MLRFVLTLHYHFRQADEHRLGTDISSKAAVVEFEDSSADEVEECPAMQSFTRNQLSLSGRGPGSSGEEVDDSESDDGKERDINCD